MTDAVVSVDLPRGDGAAREARAIVAEALEDLRPVDRSDVLLLVAELVGMVREAPTGPHLEVERVGDAVAIRATGGPEVDPDPLARDIVAQLSTSWEVGSGGVSAVMEVSPTIPGDPSEERLFALLAEGDMRARNELVERYLPFARSRVRGFRGAAERADLLQVAAAALTKALDRFDPSRGTAFTTFAGRVISGEVKRHLRDHGWSVGVPRGLQELGLEARRVTEEVAQEIGREPGLSDVSAAMDADTGEVGDAMRARESYRARSLEAPVGEGGGQLKDVLPSHEERITRVPELADVSVAMEGLSERSRRILHLRFFEGLTQAEIGERIGVSQVHVSRLLSGAIDEVRVDLGVDSP